MGERVNHQLHGARRLPSSVGGDAGKGARILEGGDVDLQATVAEGGHAGGVGDQTALGGDPVYIRVRVSIGLALQSNRLSLYGKGLGGLPSHHRWVTDELLLWDGPEVFGGKVGWGCTGLQVILTGEPAKPQELAVAVEGVSAKAED